MKKLLHGIAHTYDDMLHNAKSATHYYKMAVQSIKNHFLQKMTSQNQVVLNERISEFLNGEVPKADKLTFLDQELNFYNKYKGINADLRELRKDVKSNS